MTDIDQAVQPVADVLGDDVRFLMKSDPGGPPAGPDGTQPEMILELVAAELMKGATTLLVAFVSSLVTAAKPKIVEISSSLMARFGNKLNSLIDRGDAEADRKELEEEVTSAKKAVAEGDISDDDLTEAEKAVVEALMERGIAEEKAIEVASKVRGASADLMASA